MERYQNGSEYDNSSDEEREKEQEEIERYQASPTEPTEVLRDLDKAFRQIEEGRGAEERGPEEDLSAAEEKEPEMLFSGMETSWQEVAEEVKAEEAPPEPSPEEVLTKELGIAEEAPAEAEEAPTEEAPAETEEAPAEEAPEETAPAEAAAETAEGEEKEETPAYAAVSEEAATVDTSAVTRPLEPAPAAPEVQVDMEEVRTTLENSAPVEEVEQLPRGAKYRRIRKEQLFQIVAELVRRYAAAAMQQLAQREQQLQQLQEQLTAHQKELESLRSNEAGLRAKAEALQQQLSEREAKVASLEAELAELREKAEKLDAFGEKWMEKEDNYIRRIRELEEETSRLRSALETSGSQLQQKIEQLEQQITVYKGRIEELQRGLEYVGFVEEFDVAGGLLQAAELRTKLEELISGVGEATSRIMPASVRERLEFITAKTREIEQQLNRYRDTYSQLVDKMENKEGTIAVAVDIAVMAERIRGLTDQLRVVAQMLEMVEAFMR